jgi:hypothetical protein
VIFWTITFIILAIRYFFRGPLMHDTYRELKQFHIDEKAGKQVDKEALGVTTLKYFAVVVPLIVAKMLYLFNAYDVDPLKWPTLTIFAAYLVTFFTGKKGQGDEILPRFTPVGILINLAWLAYVTYICYWLLVAVRFFDNHSK